MNNNLFEQTQILNLDNISADTIICATIDGEKLILDKDKLYSRLGRRRRTTTNGVGYKKKSKRQENKDS